jgi:pilus assembly protein TadC
LIDVGLYVPDILFKISMFERRKETFREYGFLTKIIPIFPTQYREIFAEV